MIHEESEGIRITGGPPEWQAVYSWERFDGPLDVTVDGCTLVCGCSTRFDDLAEDLVMLDQCKAYRKGYGAMVGKSGRMPIGAETTYKVSHRYSDNALKVVKDFFVPRGLVIEDCVVIDELKLDGGFVECCTYSEDLTQSEWVAIGDRMEWPQTPIILCVKHESGIILEIGIGNDLWRWTDGFLPENDSSSLSVLERVGDDVIFSRYGARVVEKTSVVPRSYRFSWYLSWLRPKSETVAPNALIELTHRPNGDVAMGALSTALENEPDAMILFDMNTVPMPDQLRKSGAGCPCFASNQAIKRLKRMIRQLSGLKVEARKALLFKNLRPGVCLVGNHVHGKGERRHWDMNSILDFALWVRQTLGDDWELTNDAVMDLPSLMGAFSTTDHLEPPVHYEFDPDLS